MDDPVHGPGEVRDQIFEFALLPYLEPLDGQVGVISWGQAVSSGGVDMPAGFEMDVYPPEADPPAGSDDQHISHGA